MHRLRAALAMPGALRYCTAVLCGTALRYCTAALGRSRHARCPQILRQLQLISGGAYRTFPDCRCRTLVPLVQGHRRAGRGGRPGPARGHARQSALAGLNPGPDFRFRGRAEAVLAACCDSCSHAPLRHLAADSDRFHAGHGRRYYVCLFLLVCLPCRPGRGRHTQLQLAYRLAGRERLFRRWPHGIVVTGNHHTSAYLPTYTACTPSYGSRHVGC